jgi:hypothetical protein
MRYLLIAVVALFGSIPGRSEASPPGCAFLMDCPTITLSITDAVTDKSVFVPDGIFVVNAFEPLKFEFITTYQSPATGVALNPYFFFPESPPFIQTNDSIPDRLTDMGENFFFSGYFSKPGTAVIVASVFDNANGSNCLGGFECSGNVILVEPNVPEPSTWIMLLIGFAAIGFAGYRRR